MIYVPDPADQRLWSGLLPSWLLSLEAEGKSPHTLNNYRWAPVQLAAWLHDHDHADDVHTLTADHLRAWLAHLLATRSEATARSRYVGITQFLAWCVDEGELDTNPMANVKPPTVHTKPVPMYSPDQLKRLLADCNGKAFADVRDKALVSFFADTGCRRGEVAGMAVADVDLRERVAVVVGKGSKTRTVAFGVTTARNLDRYLRARTRQPYSERDWLWLGTTGKGRLTGNGIYQLLRRRTTRLGLPDLHPHMLRHGFADAWLRAGGSETDLMELAGWSSRQMVSRYAAANRSERAREAHRRLSPMDSL